MLSMVYRVSDGSRMAQECGRIARSFFLARDERVCACACYTARESSRLVDDGYKSTKSLDLWTIAGQLSCQVRKKQGHLDKYIRLID